MEYLSQKNQFEQNKEGNRRGRLHDDGLNEINPRPHKDSVLQQTSEKGANAKLGKEEKRLTTHKSKSVVVAPSEALSDYETKRIDNDSSIRIDEVFEAPDNDELVACVDEAQRDFSSKEKRLLRSLMMSATKAESYYSGMRDSRKGDESKRLDSLNHHTAAYLFDDEDDGDLTFEMMKCMSKLNQDTFSFFISAPTMSCCDKILHLCPDHDKSADKK